MLAIRDRSGREVWLLSGSRIALGAVELGSAITMVVIAAAVARPSDRWPAFVVLALAMLAMTLPDSEAGLLGFVGYGGWWVAVDRSASWGAVLAAALAGLVFHLALAHAAAAPSGAVIRPAVLRAVLGDAGILVVLTCVATLVVAAMRGAGVHAPTFVIGVALTLVGLLPWAATLGGRTRDPSS